MRTYGEQERSAFNDAFSFVGRCSYWWFLCGQHSQERNFQEWFNVLEILQRELSDDMIKSFQEYWKQSEDLRHKLTQIMNSMAMQKQKQGQAITISPITYEMLRDLEIILRMVWRLAGYKTRFEDDPRFAH